MGPSGGATVGGRGVAVAPGTPTTVGSSGSGDADGARVGHAVSVAPGATATPRPPTVAPPDGPMRRAFLPMAMVRR